MAIVRAVTRRQVNPYFIMVSTLFYAGLLWPLRVMAPLSKWLWFAEAAERREWMIGTLILSMDVSDKFRRYVSRDLARIEKRFTARGIELPGSQ